MVVLFVMLICYGCATQGFVKYDETLSGTAKGYVDFYDDPNPNVPNKGPGRVIWIVSLIEDGKGRQITLSRKERYMGALDITRRVVLNPGSYFFEIWGPSKDPGTIWRTGPFAVEVKENMITPVRVAVIRTGYTSGGLFHNDFVSFGLQKVVEEMKPYAGDQEPFYSAPVK
jgi:hypothetical protein